MVGLLSKKDLEKVHGSVIRVKNQDFVMLPMEQLASLLNVRGNRRAGVEVKVVKGGARKARPVVEAEPFMLNTIARSLKAARSKAGLTQMALAERMGITQSRVAQAENGVSVSQVYIGRVLEACGLPKDWKPGR